MVNDASRLRPPTRRVTAFVVAGGVVAGVLTTSCSLVAPEAPGSDRRTATIRADRATVVEVVDGDTVRLEVAGRPEAVRLIGVDAPETRHPTKGVQCFGPEASRFLAVVLPPGTTLRLERDAEARDAYARLLLYVFVATPTGERFVNLELVARGFARPLAIEPNVRYRREFVAAAFDAERNRRGLWGGCK